MRDDFRFYTGAALHINADDLKPKAPGRAMVVFNETRLKRLLDVPDHVRIVGAEYNAINGTLSIAIEADGLPEYRQAAFCVPLIMQLNELRGAVGTPE